MGIQRPRVRRLQARPNRDPGLQFRAIWDPKTPDPKTSDPTELGSGDSNFERFGIQRPRIRRLQTRPNWDPGTPISSDLGSKDPGSKDFRPDRIGIRGLQFRAIWWSLNGYVPAGCHFEDDWTSRAQNGLKLDPNSSNPAELGSKNPGPEDFRPDRIGIRGLQFRAIWWSLNGYVPGGCHFEC